MKFELLGNPITPTIVSTMDNYIITANAPHFAKGCLVFGITNHRDIANYIISTFVQLLFDEFEKILWHASTPHQHLCANGYGPHKIVNDYHKPISWYTPTLCQQSCIKKYGAHNILNKVSSMFFVEPKSNVSSMIEPSLLLILLQQCHDSTFTGKDNDQNIYEIKNKFKHHEVMYDVQIKWGCVMPRTLSGLVNDVIEYNYEYMPQFIVSKCTL